MIKSFEILDGADGAVSFSHRGERHFVPAAGANGGREGGLAKSWVERKDGRIEEVASKLVGRLEVGDKLVISTAGGGGWGEPNARDYAKVAADVANGKVSAEAAERMYRATGVGTRDKRDS